MNQPIFLTLLAIIIASLSDQVTTQTANCDYAFTQFTSFGVNPIKQSFYACSLNTNGINFGAEVMTIQGQHAARNSDADVKYLAVINHNKLKKFTSLFCKKFPNIEIILINDAGLEVLDVDSLFGCAKLKYLILGDNEIQQLPEYFLIRSSKLIKLALTNNRLTELPENLFLSQEELEELDLDNNQIKLLPSNIFRPLVKLEMLLLDSNKLESLNPAWFETLQNLKGLGLDKNELTEIPSKCFATLVNLEKLRFYDNKIKTLKSDSFDGLQNLHSFKLERNKIADLPAGVFTPLINLKQFEFSDNKLTTIHSDSFGIHNQLTLLALKDNQINAIDPKIIDNTAIIGLDMRNNICSHLQVFKKDEIKSSLQKCFDNYQPRTQQVILESRFSQPSEPVQKEIYCGQQIGGHGNIIGGAHAIRGDYPWNAALVQTNFKFFCGGSVVTTQKVVTAAHCIQDKGDRSPKLPRDIIASLGVYDLKNLYEVGRENFPVQNINMHPDWNPQAESFDYDIAVLVLANEVTFGSLIQPICLPRSNSIEEITSGYVVGYGKSEDTTKTHENIPKIIDIPIHKNEDCFLKYNSLLKISSHRTFCGGTGTGVGVCNGDSGSGLIVSDGNAYYLRGVVSSSLIGGQYGCDVDAYSVFTDVTYYFDWIISIPISRF